MSEEQRVYCEETSDLKEFKRELDDIHATAVKHVRELESDLAWWQGKLDAIEEIICTYGVDVQTGFVRKEPLEKK